MSAANSCDNLYSEDHALHMPASSREIRARYLDNDTFSTELGTARKVPGIGGTSIGWKTFTPVYKSC